MTTDPDLVGGYVTDFRRQYTGSTLAVLRSRTTQEVQHIVRTCLARGVPLIPVGGNTSYCAAATPGAVGGEFVLSLERMNAVREVDAGNLSLCAEAGAILGDLQRAAADAGLTPFIPGLSRKAILLPHATIQLLQTTAHLCNCTTQSQEFPNLTETISNFSVAISNF